MLGPMMRSPSTGLGFTLIELMVVLAVAALLVVLAAPSFQDMIVMQRLRGINAQLVTDLQFARSEAVAQGRVVRVNLGFDSAQTCYVIYTAAGNDGAGRCECVRGVGAACTAPNSHEIRTVVAPRSGQVNIEWPAPQDTGFGYDPTTGGLISIPSDDASAALGAVQIDVRVDDDRRLRDKINQTGRPTVCAPNAARMQVQAC